MFPCSVPLLPVENGDPAQVVFAADGCVQLTNAMALVAAALTVKFGEVPLKLGAFSFTLRDELPVARYRLMPVATATPWPATLENANEVAVDAARAGALPLGELPPPGFVH